VERCFKKWCGNFFLYGSRCGTHTPKFENNFFRSATEDSNIGYVNRVTRIKTRCPMRRLSTTVSEGPKKGGGSNCTAAQSNSNSNLWDQRALPRVVRVSRYIVQKVKWRPGTSWCALRTRQCGYFVVSNFNSAKSGQGVGDRKFRAAGALSPLLTPYSSPVTINEFSLPIGF
jgi:hypothetical protein